MIQISVSRLLDVDIPEQLSSYAMQGVAIETDRLGIQEDAEGAELLEVDVELRGDTVTFGWADPWTGDDVAMTCTRA